MLVEDDARAPPDGDVEHAVAADVEAGGQHREPSSPWSATTSRSWASDRNETWRSWRGSPATTAPPGPQQGGGRQGWSIEDASSRMTRSNSAGDGRQQVVDVGQRAGPQGQGPGELVVVERRQPGSRRAARPLRRAVASAATAGIVAPVQPSGLRSGCRRQPPAAGARPAGPRR